MSLTEIPFYVVTTKSLTKRHAHLRKLEKRIGIDFEFIFDFDIDELDAKDLAKVNSDMPLASISCLLKHFEAQRRFLQTDKEFCIVLEDDVILFNAFESAIAKIMARHKELTPGWLIFLGGADNKIDKRVLETDAFDLVEYPMSTAECYILDRQSCVKRSKWIDQHGFIKPADHQLTYMDQCLGIKHYRLGRPVATQGSITGQFTTTLDDSRRKHSSIFLWVKYTWNRLRRQQVPRMVSRHLRKIR